MMGCKCDVSCPDETTVITTKPNEYDSPPGHELTPLKSSMYTNQTAIKRSSVDSPGLEWHASKW